MHSIYVCGRSRPVAGRYTPAHKIDSACKYVRRGRARRVQKKGVESVNKARPARRALQLLYGPVPDEVFVERENLSEKKRRPFNP